MTTAFCQRIHERYTLLHSQYISPRASGLSKHHQAQIGMMIFQLFSTSHMSISNQTATCPCHKQTPNHSHIPTQLCFCSLRTQQKSKWWLLLSSCRLQNKLSSLTDTPGQTPAPTHKDEHLRRHIRRDTCSNVPGRTLAPTYQDEHLRRRTRMNTCSNTPGQTPAPTQQEGHLLQRTRTNTCANTSGGTPAPKYQEGHLHQHTRRDNCSNAPGQTPVPTHQEG